MSEETKSQPKELWETVKSSVGMRLGNPVIGSFVVSWCIVNWRLIAVLFAGSGAMEDRINRINCYYISIDSMLWLPAGPAILVVILIPVFEILVAWVRVWPDRLVWEAKNKNDAYIAEKEYEVSAKKRKTSENNNYVANSELNQLNVQIASLRQIEENLKQNIATLKEKNSVDGASLEVKLKESSNTAPKNYGNKSTGEGVSSEKSVLSSRAFTNYFFFNSGVDGESHFFLKMEGLSPKEVAEICRQVPMISPFAAKVYARELGDIEAYELVSIEREWEQHLNWESRSAKSRVMEDSIRFLDIYRKKEKAKLLDFPEEKSKDESPQSVKNSK